MNRNSDVKKESAAGTCLPGNLDDRFTVYDQLLGMAELDCAAVHGQPDPPPGRLPAGPDKIGMMWILSGACQMRIEDLPYVLSARDFMLIPSYGSVRFDSANPGFLAKVMLVNKTFMEECITNKQILSFFHCLFIKRMLQTQITREEMVLLNADFNNLKEKINTSVHSFYREVIPVNFLSFVLDVTHILNNKKESRVSSQSTRKEELFNKFLGLLLEHYREQHEVTFYADKLFITPQYLTLIIKELSGKTTNKWIDDTLILEAQKLLKTTQTTVQQIADLLNFSDQSTFGKFFKKYHGVSPAEYRRLYYSSLSIA
jgi:AraC-like DNA-binding protein